MIGKRPSGSKMIENDAHTSNTDESMKQSAILKGKPSEPAHDDASNAIDSVSAIPS